MSLKFTQPGGPGTGVYEAVDSKGTRFELSVNKQSKKWTVRIGGYEVASEKDNIEGFSNAKAFAEQYENQSPSQFRTRKTAETPIKSTSKKVSEPAKHISTKKSDANARMAGMPSTVKATPANIAKQTPAKSNTSNVKANETKSTAVKSPEKSTKAVTTTGKSTNTGKSVQNGAQTAKTGNSAKSKNVKKTEPVKNGVKPATKTAKPAEKRTIDVRMRDAGISRWNNWGSSPELIPYALLQLLNARASRNYSILHGRLHPYTATSKRGYVASVGRCKAAEERLYNLLTGKATVGKSEVVGALPKNYKLQFEYFRAKGRKTSDLLATYGIVEVEPLTTAIPGLELVTKGANLTVK